MAYIKPSKILSHKDGYFILRLKSEDVMKSVLEGGPYFMNRRIVIVKKWSVEFDLRAEVLIRLSVWFQLPKLPLVCWSKDSLSRIGSLLGKPMCAE